MVPFLRGRAALEHCVALPQVRQVQDYKYHETVGARAQLAAHPAAAQFLLDNAANAERNLAVNMWGKYLLMLLMLLW